MKILDARYIAEIILKIASQNPENNDMTNMKLQKLLYYTQGTFLALHGQRMFEQSIVKWQYGPVVPVVYHEYKMYGNQLIEAPEVDMQFIEKEQFNVIKMVYDFFGQFSAFKLMDLTHNEPPWNSVEMGEEIQDDVITEYFNTIVIKDEK
jgi:uncharacterized phage-associated protein